MWRIVDEQKREIAKAAMKSLSNLMKDRFSSILFRHTLDYILEDAFLPAGANIRYRVHHLRVSLPRTEAAHEKIESCGGFNAVRNQIKVEHITSVKKLGEIFQLGDYDGVIDSFNLCVVTNDEYRLLGKGCGADRYTDNNISIVVPNKIMVIDGCRADP